MLVCRGINDRWFLCCIQSSISEDSFVEISHSDVPKHSQVKYHPYRCSSGSGHYAELARTIGSERRSSYSKHVESQSAAKPSTTNPYIEELHLRLSKTGGKPQMPPTLARSPVTPTPRKISPPGTPQSQAPFRNEYVESVHAKLQQMGSGGRRHQPVAQTPQAHLWISALEKVRLDTVMAYNPPPHELSVGAGVCACENSHL